MSVHYTAVVIVERVTEASPAVFDKYNNITTPSVERKSEEVAKITVRSIGLPGVVEKVKSHVDLVNEI